MTFCKWLGAPGLCTSQFPIRLLLFRFMSSQTSNPNSGPLVLRQPPRPKALGFALSFIVLAIYCGFVLLVGYDKPLLGREITPGLSWGILLGALVIVSAWVLTFIYVAASNKLAAGK